MKIKGLVRKRSYVIFMSVFFVIICLNFGIHALRTARFNRTIRTITPQTQDSDCTFSLKPQNDNEVSWTISANIDGKTVNLNACTYVGSFQNKSDIEVSDWSLRINIKDDCLINSAWCGKVEIHQNFGEKEKVQTLDLRELHDVDISLKNYIDGDLKLIPLKKGDYIIYYPDEVAKEKPLTAFNNEPGKALIGFIFYWRPSKIMDLSDYEIQYQNKKSLFQGTEAVICLVASSIWLLLLVAGISNSITIRLVKDKTEMELTKKHNQMLNEEVENRTKRILDMQQKIVLSLAELVESRDNSTGGHVKRTSDVVKILLEEIKAQDSSALDSSRMTDIVRAAPMHDLGKIHIDNSILKKPERLTDAEFEIMKDHANKSGEIVQMLLRGVEEEHFVKTAFNVAKYHHERWDGSGYPEGLSGEAIPFESRIMAIADVYDALVSERCYKKAMSFEEANKIMCESMGTHFDPALQPIFSGCRERLEDYYRNHA